MRKAKGYDRTIHAFWEYGNACILYALDGAAMDAAFDRMTECEKKAVRYCYMQADSLSAKMRGSHVKRFSQDNYYSIEQVYRILASARRKYETERKRIKAGRRK